jgi:hypothetical protein
VIQKQGHTNPNRGNLVPKTEITDGDIQSVIDQGRKDPVVMAFAGKKDTCKSGALCDLISHLPDGRMGVILDFDHSIIPIIDSYHSERRDKFLVINATSFGKEYKKGLLTGLAALEYIVKSRGKEIGLLATEGMDRLYQRSFKMTMQARGYDMEDVRFFGKGGETEFTPTDWMIRNDYNIDPFDLLYNYAAELGIDLVMTTHTTDEVNSKREIVSVDEPVWYKTIPDYLSYLFIMKRKESGDVVRRYAVCDKDRFGGGVYGMEFTVQEFNKKEKKASFSGIYGQLKEQKVKMKY